jgi:hypothetical protein
MFFDPAIVATLKLKEETTHEDNPARALALIPAKEPGKAKPSRKQRVLGFTFKRQS